MIRFYSAEQVHAALEWRRLAEALNGAFVHGAEVPLRHAHALGGGDTLLLMPAWRDDALGVKLVTVMPGAPARGGGTVAASYLLLDRATGEPRALIDGEALTLRRTAAASALAARYLARPDATRMLMVGCGKLAPWLVRAHCALRPGLVHVALWGRRNEPAQSLAQALRDEGLPVEAVEDLGAAARGAQLISCATTATVPIVRGAWLAPGTHLDLVGGFTRTMREVDDAAVARSRIVVDTYRGALAEAGDLVGPLESKVISREAVVAELAEILRGDVRGRTDADQVTLFKSVGTALEDLAAAQLVAAGP